MNIEMNDSELEDNMLSGINALSIEETEKVNGGVIGIAAAIGVGALVVSFSILTVASYQAGLSTGSRIWPQR